MRWADAILREESMGKANAGRVHKKEGIAPNPRVKDFALNGLLSVEAMRRTFSLLVNAEPSGLAVCGLRDRAGQQWCEIRWPSYPEDMMKFRPWTGRTGVEKGICRSSINGGVRHLASCTRVKLISSTEAATDREAACFAVIHPSWRAFCVERVSTTSLNAANVSCWG
jgi:hypothetical protein